MGEMLIGTCSWTDRALVASGWYPPDQRDAEGRLRYYAKQFPVVEVDATYYALPSRRNSLLWAARTPAGFRFDVKAFSLLTGHPTRTEALPATLRHALRGRSARAAWATWAAGGGGADAELMDEVWERFSGALEPLRQAGRLGTLLFQFPPWFAPGARSEEALGRCVARAAGWPVAVEFRHPDWWGGERREATAALLTELGATAVAVDMTQTLPVSVPPVTPITTRRLAVVRFHGRNAAWGSGSKEERFRHAYAEAELAEWIPRVRRLAEGTDEVHVLFNNCCADAAVRAAESMRGLLAQATSG
ncbi:DUF72 domain-containing protein [Streptomyces zagrosensis]|uniref:Uncharacterized protein YecE (DUF72 family) n=1 Tax=Streptomyces zagrosensis TaxID=1042984 RepID=A0A7W9UXH5_9ACTN|nr:DUF72 domain-containing protein [Streptomyces zagrosensis]MBB5934321.1 uncharacterized protein YecE (DUF72 family) [Streptomyces zagrosensis]